MNVNFRNFAIWLVILFMLMGLFQVFQSSTRNISVTDKSYSQFVSDVDAGSVTSVTITDNVVSGTLRDGTRFETMIPAGADIVSRLEDHGVQITARAPESSPFWSILLSAPGCRSSSSSASGSSSSARCRAAAAAARWALASRAPSF